MYRGVLVSENIRIQTGKIKKFEKLTLIVVQIKEKISPNEKEKKEKKHQI